MRVLALILFLVAPALADPNEVDVELFLAVDVSRSMSPAELEIQRRGYAEALRSAQVAEAIAGGPIGEIALTYVEWAGQGAQRIVVPWTRIRTMADAAAFADRIETHFDPALRRTSISGALRHATESLETNAFKGLRRVIDVSGDGPNNSGRPVLRARRATLDKGITINGLPLMTRDGIDARWHLEDLDLYYLSCVIGGPGAFVIPVRDWSEFAEAVRRKLVLEIAGMPTERLWRAENRGQTPDGYDCLIGEKMWEQNRRLWEGP